MAIAFASSASPSPSGYGICGLASTTLFTEMSFFVGSTGELVTGSDDGGGTFHYVNNSVSVLDGKSHLAVFTFEPVGIGGTFTGYLDGVTFGNFALTALTTMGAPLATCGWSTLGVNGVAHYWPGRLQSFIIYDALLSSSDIANLYTSFLG